MKKVVNTPVEEVHVSTIGDNNIIGIQHKGDLEDKAFLVKIDTRKYVAVSVPNDSNGLAEFESIAEFCNYFSDNYEVYIFKDKEELREWLLK